MKILIRTDASVTIGSGHVIRCLTVAEELRNRDHEVIFFMKSLPGNLIEFVTSRGFQVVDSFRAVDVCIIDHYSLDVKWEKSIRPYVNKIVVIDDLANRVHDCDILLDQNVVPNYEERYDSLVPEHCVKLLGTKFLIMRNEFVEQRKRLKDRSYEVKNLLVFMGGTDPTGETIKVLHALQQAGKDFKCIDIVVGEGNPESEVIRVLCEELNYHYHCQINYIASLMNKADFSIGAGGSTTWERCYVGLPSSSTIVAENQIEATKMASSLGAVWNLGWHEDVSIQTYIKLILSLSEKQDELRKMSSEGLRLTENKVGPNPWIEYLL